MRDFSTVSRETADPMWRQEEEDLARLSADPDNEIFHLQADGFYGPEKGFQDAEQIRRQRERKN